MKTMQTIALAIMMIVSASAANAQEANSSSGIERSGFRIHTPYWGLGLSVPMGMLRWEVPPGLSTRFGSIFYFHKPGIAKGLLNIGLDASWINVESNVPFSQIGESNMRWSMAVSQTYGPIVTVNIVGDLYTDLYYRAGWGFRVFPGHDNNFSFWNTSSAVSNKVRIHAMQNVGINLRWKILYTNFGFNMLSTTSYYDFTTFQFLVGVCARIK